MSQEELKVVSSCPKCGAPVYSQASASGGVPRTVYSCECRLQQSKSTSNANKGMFKHGSATQVEPTLH